MSQKSTGARAKPRKKNGNGNGHGKKNGNGYSKKNGNGNGHSNGNGRKSTTRRRNSARATDSGAMIVRRNSTTLTTRSAPQPDLEPEPRSISQRIDDMGASHVATAVGSGAAFTALAVTAVGQGWIGGKTSAGILMGVGAATTAVGVHGEHDHVMMAGAGMAAAGALSLANQLAVDGYEAIEKRAAERKAKRQAEQADKDKAKKLAEARALLAEEEKKRRNARIVITDPDGNPLEFAMREAAPGDHDEDHEHPS